MSELNPYRKAYLKLINQITDVIESLVKVQQEAEEIFLNTPIYDEAPNKVIDISEGSQEDHHTSD